ncbi:MAG TPA: hypothetical protein VKQ29_09620 [Aliidongia sp.]|nr:hypothetical protein [Aliidongia sp.]
MAAVPRFTVPSIAASPAFVGVSRRPAAATRRLPRLRALAPVAADTTEGWPRVSTSTPVSDVAASWIVVAALSLLAFVLL